MLASARGGSRAIGRQLLITVSLGGLAAAAIPAPAASETVTYSYDALGRLVGVSTSGGPNDGVGVGTTYDPAGNRCTYTVGGAGGGGGSAECPDGGGGPPPGNQPPVTGADFLAVEQCGSGSVNVTANDSDPEGHLPLAVTQVAGGSKGIPVVVSGSTVGYSSTGGLGPDSFTYTVADSLGATATGTVNVQITGEQQEICP